MLLAVLCGGAIGIEREYKRRPAGFRTHILICLGAAMVSLTSEFLFLYMKYYLDISRMSAAVASGIGFIGAGTIIVTGQQQVKGLTTAAGLWASACMGLCIGAGFAEGALFGCVLIILTIIVFSRMERAILSRARNLNIYVEFPNIDDLGAIITAIKAQEIRIFDVEIQKHKTVGVNQSAVFSVRLPKRMTHTEVMSVLASVENVRAIEEL